MSFGVSTDRNDEIPIPTSMQELESLIQALYASTTSPADVTRINHTLNKLQNSPQGWQLAHELTSSNQEHSQFFAALTFTIKLNTDW